MDPTALATFVSCDSFAWLLRHAIYFRWGARIVGNANFSKLVESYRSNLGRAPHHLVAAFGSVEGQNVWFGLTLIQEGIMLTNAYGCYFILAIYAFFFNF